MFKYNVKILGNTVTQTAPNISNRILKKKKKWLYQSNILVILANYLKFQKLKPKKKKYLFFSACWNDNVVDANKNNIILDIKDGTFDIFLHQTLLELTDCSSWLIQSKMTLPKRKSKFKRYYLPKGIFKYYQVSGITFVRLW